MKRSRNVDVYSSSFQDEADSNNTKLPCGSFILFECDTLLCSDRLDNYWLKRPVIGTRGDCINCVNHIESCSHLSKYCV